MNFITVTGQDDRPCSLAAAEAVIVSGWLAVVGYTLLPTDDIPSRIPAVGEDGAG